MSVSDDDILNELTKSEKANNLEKEKTALMKARFIKDIKAGLGEKIKENPNKISHIKKPWYLKVKLFFKKLFTEF